MTSDKLDPRVLRTVTVLAAVAAVFVALAIPFAHYSFGVRYHVGRINAEAAATARELSRLVGRNPELWQFETVRIDAILKASESRTDVERLRVLDADGSVVTSAGVPAPDWPRVEAVRPLLDSGRLAGRFEVVRSIRWQLFQSLGLLTLSTLVGLGVFAALRLVPLRILRQSIDRAEFLASHDPLTGLPNRALFGEWLRRAVEEVRSDGSTAAVLCLDLDRFKEVNDTLGHHKGDALLCQVARRVSAVLRRGDLLARFGGDEFAIIQTCADQPGSASALAARIVETLADPFDLDGVEAIIGVSIGVAVCAPTGSRPSAAQLVQQADLALYRVKAEGRGAFRFFEEAMNLRLVERRTLESDLRLAIARRELELHYQPQVDMATRDVIGVEALLRWRHPTRGWVAPDQFIGLAEETGLILPIGDWCIQTACRQAVRWPGVRFAVNVSPVQFRHGNLVDTVRAALAETGIEPSRLELEITEGVMLNDTAVVLGILTAIRALGVRIAMDDFGTGYSSLSYLRSFPFDKIKIDRSFVADLGVSGTSEGIIDAVVALGRALGMRSNAEGIETEEQARHLLGRGCDEVQGFLFSRALPSDEFERCVVSDPATGRLRLRSGAGLPTEAPAADVA